eukprot:15454066-Alexandrium_andersonii.AAC.1
MSTRHLAPHPRKLLLGPWSAADGGPRALTPLPVANAQRITAQFQGQAPGRRRRAASPPHRCRREPLRDRPPEAVGH